jgi:hypothetical protein
MIPLKAIIMYGCMPFVLNLTLSAQFSNNPCDARHAGMAGNGSVLSDGWSGFHNQAGLAHVHDITMALHYENHFLVSENSIKAVAVDLPVVKGTLGINYSFFGYAAYYESRVGLAYGKSFGDRLATGIQLNYMMIHQPAGYGNMHVVVPEGGVLVQPVYGLYFGFHLFNPARQHFPQNNEQGIPSILKIGLGYRMVENVFLCLEAEKETGEKQVIRVGAEYEMAHKITLRLGVSTSEISRYAVGMGYRFGKLNVDFAISHHRWLGFTPYLTIGYTMAKKDLQH